jgi:Sulfate permease family
MVPSYPAMRTLETAYLPRPVPQVDYNKELVTVGISNLLTGLTGTGFTGSYIFSQTVFTMRTGCTSRLNGAVIVVAEALLFFLPFSFVECASSRMSSSQCSASTDAVCCASCMMRCTACPG